MFFRSCLADRILISQLATAGTKSKESRGKNGAFGELDSFGAPKIDNCNLPNPPVINTDT